MGCGASSESFGSSKSIEERCNLRATEDYGRSISPPAADTGEEQQDSIPAGYQQNDNYGETYQKMYTIKEISDHNISKHFCDLFPWKQTVNSSVVFKKQIEAAVKELERDVEEQEKLNFNKDWTMTPIAIVMMRGLKFMKIKQALVHSKVATLNVYSDKQYSEDINEDAKCIANDLRNDNNKTTYQVEYLHLLQRFFELFAKHAGNIPRNPPVQGGDPNTAPFLLPESVINDLISLRAWIVNWEPFDTELNYDNEFNCPWNVLSKSDPVIVDLITPDEQFRMSLYSNGDTTFDCEIEGEAAWNLLPIDVIKNDTTTPEQKAIWEKRDKRTDLHDRDRMKRRRLELANYFIKERADGLESYCDDFLRFADNLEEGWKKFEQLCENS